VNTEEALAALVGAWRIDVVEDRDREDEPWSSYGERPDGVIIYDRTGTLSAHLVAAGRPPTSEGYLGYWGTFAIADVHRDGDAIAGTLLHRVEGGYPAFLFEEGPERPFRLDGDELVLGDGRTTRRVLQRIVGER
jgi:hypothetical protein